MALKYSWSHTSHSLVTGWSPYIVAVCDRKQNFFSFRYKKTQNIVNDPESYLTEGRIQSMYCLYLTEIDWHCVCLCVCVCTSLFGKDWRTAHLQVTAHTHSKREREGERDRQGREKALLHSSSGICFSPGELRERTCCPHCWMREGQKERSEWMDRTNEWGARSGTRLTGLVWAGIEHASLAGSGRQCCYLRTDLLPNGLAAGGEAASSCCSFRPEPVPAPAACTARSDMGPVCCKPDRLKKQHLQGNGKQMLEIFFTRVAETGVERLSGF